MCGISAYSNDIVLLIYILLFVWHCFPSELVGWHSDERWSELIITCSVRDSRRRNIINQAVTT